MMRRATRLTPVLVVRPAAPRPTGQGARWLGAAVLLVLPTAVSGCSGTTSAAPLDRTEVVASQPGVVDPDHPERFALAPVEGRVVHDELTVSGVVTPDITRTVPVLSLGGGRVVDIRARLGDNVQKGQVLLRIHSPDLAAALSDYQKDLSDEVLARTQLDRARLLLDRGAIAKKDVEMAQGAADKAGVDVSAAAERVRLLGGDPDHPSPIIDLKAPLSGTIVEQNISGGAAVRSTDNSPNLFVVTDLSRVWVLCDLYEDGLARVRTGDAAEVRLDAYPGRVFAGRVDNIGQVLDPATRTAKLRIELDNRDRVMRAGMFVTGLVRSRGAERRPVIPAAAAMRMQDRDWVFRSLGGGRFARTAVELGPATDDRLQQVLSGVAVGDAVVANALQFARAAETR